MKKSLGTIVFTISLLIIFFHNLLFSTSSNSSSATFKPSAFDVNEENLIAEIPSEKIKLYYSQKDKKNGMLVGFYLKVNTTTRFYDWKNVISPNYTPELLISDINNDGSKELIILLNKGYGATIYIGDVHIFDLANNFSEILVENPIVGLYKNVEVTTSSEEFKLTVNNQGTIIKKSEVLTPPYDHLTLSWSSDNLRYQLRNNILYANIGVFSNNTPIGELLITYTYNHNILEIADIHFSR